LSPAPLTIVESSQLLGRFCYVERELHRRVGALAGPGDPGRAPAPPVPPGVRVWLAGAAMAHAWRAAQIRPLLPVSVGLPGEAELTRSPGPEVGEALDLATAPFLEADSLLTGIVEIIYASMLEGYEQRLAAASPASDPAVSRVLARLAGDLRSVRAAGARLLDDGYSSSISAGRDSDHARAGRAGSLERLRQSVIAAGGVFGSLH
jgi:hypothetical protein